MASTDKSKFGEANVLFCLRDKADQTETFQTAYRPILLLKKIPARICVLLSIKAK